MLPSFITSVFFGDGPKDSGATTKEPITEKTTVRGEIHEEGLESYAVSGMQGWRLSMEDAHLVCTDIPVEGVSKKLKGHAIFGVMDGHGGDFTSVFASHHFMEFFSSNSRWKKYAGMSVQDRSNVPGLECLKPALTETFARLDVEIRKQQNIKNEQKFRMQQKQPSPRVRYERSGSTCCVVLVTPSHIVCANAGDSRAILRRAGTVLPLSFDHKPTNPPEFERIGQANGFVKAKRVDGDLAVSRGLGDFTYKGNELLPVNQQKVIPNPDFVTYPRTKEDEFMVLACDGIWDVASNEQCGSFLQSLLDEGESDLGLICEEAIDTCLDKNSRDNMTIAMVSFSGCKIATGGLGLIWQRRTARQARHLQASAKQAATRAYVGLSSPVSVGSNNNNVNLPSCS